MSKPMQVHVVYRPKKGQEEALMALVRKHWPVLRKAGLATGDEPLIYRAVEKETHRPFFVEIFSWADEKAPGLAHQMPEVMAIWEPMGPMIEGGPSPELAVIVPMSIDDAP